MRCAWTGGCYGSSGSRARASDGCATPRLPLTRHRATTRWSRSSAVEAGPMSEWVPGLLWLVVLLGFNAFFVGAEFAVIAARRSQIEPLADAGGRAARTTLWAMEHATLMLAASQLGITICSLLILNVSEPAIHHLLEYPLALTRSPPRPSGYSPSSSVWSWSPSCTSCWG